MYIICVIFPACFSSCSTEQHSDRGQSSVLEESAQVNGSVVPDYFKCSAIFESTVKQGRLLLILRPFRVLGIEGIELCCMKTNIDLRAATEGGRTSYWTTQYITLALYQ